MALYRTYRYAYLWWPGVEVADETMVARTFLEAHWRSYGYIYLWQPGIESTDETGKLPRYVSTVLSFAPHLVGNGFIRSACYGFVGTFRSG